jgi:hypothetical protein
VVIQELLKEIAQTQQVDFKCETEVQRYVFQATTKEPYNENRPSVVITNEADLPMWATQWQVRGHLFIFTKPIASMSMGLTYYDVKANMLGTTITKI